MYLLGLIGNPLSHSFSKKYFEKKFIENNIQNFTYQLFPIETITLFPKLIEQHAFLGLNVTIPYKETIIAYLDEISPIAQRIGAVNTIHFYKGKKIGYNTDYFGFKESLKPFLAKKNLCKALILGDGGASKAVQVALEDVHIPFEVVSRKSNPLYISYEEALLRIPDSQLIINTSPVGMHPHNHQCPQIAYTQLGLEHFLYDLVYNPEETLFLQKGQAQGATTKNGLEMLCLQANEAWRIWNT